MSPPLAVQMPVNGFVSLAGVCRFYVIALEPEVRLYMTPIDLSPRDADPPVVRPAAFAKRLVKAAGLFKTRGQPSEWTGLASGRLPETAFVADLEKNFQARTAAAHGGAR